jgi:hypothetical protein
MEANIEEGSVTPLPQSMRAHLEVAAALLVAGVAAFLRDTHDIPEPIGENMAHMALLDWLERVSVAEDYGTKQ